jgi:hypothetical protein
MLFEIFQTFRTSKIDKTAKHVSYKANDNELSIQTLKDQIDHLSLVCEAVCELLEEIGFNKSMLADKIKEIDLRDGKLDGKYVKKSSCPACKRDVASRHIKCIYCGSFLK